MSFSTEDNNGYAPKLYMSDTCLNLDNQFSNVDLSKAESMCVYARIRPMLKSELDAGHKECIAVIDEQTVRAVFPSTSSKHKSTVHGTQDIIEDFTYTSAYGPETGQFVFFTGCMMTTIQNFIEGQNSLVFSYGSTGSGKTFTLQGNEDNPGIIPLSLHLFFASIEKQLGKSIVVKPDKFSDVIVLNDNDKKKELQLKEQLLSYTQEDMNFKNMSKKSFAMVLCDTFSEKYEVGERTTTLGPEDMAQAQAATLMKEIGTKSAEKQSDYCSVWVSFVEIYNENVYDLLQFNINQRTKLNLGEDKNGDVYVKGLREVCVSNCYEALKLLTLGQKNLKIASTKLNYQSSRSHCIYTIKVIRFPDPENITYAKVNRLSFCDLAGSERASKSQTIGVRLKEAGCINTSLLVLGRCLEQLRTNPNLKDKDKKLVPFRESKLTRLFSGFFIGKGKAVMIANASPSELTFDETLHVLRFSAVAKELIINDSYITTASNTLQTITNLWNSAKTNSRLSSEKSISFDDSMEEVIQEKDELIEKLLNLAESLRNNLETEKKDNAELEIKIRQEVCQEYSEFSDELLANQKQTFEEECETIKEIYKKRLSNMEKMYEKIIKEYKSQLEESFSSEDEPADNTSRIIEVETMKEKVDNGTKKILENSELDCCEEKISKHLYEYETIALKNNLEIVNEELKQKKEELQKVLIHAAALEKVITETEEKLKVSNLDLQNALSVQDELKKQKDFMQQSYQEEIINLVKEKTLSSESGDSTKMQKLALEEKVKYLSDELVNARKEKETIKEKAVVYESKITDYKNQIQKLNGIVTEMTELQHESQVDFEKAMTEMEKKCLDENNNLKNALQELSEERSKISMLESDILSLTQNVAELQNEKKNNNKTIKNISKELDESKLIISTLEEKLEKCVVHMKETISELNEEINELKVKDIENEKKYEAAVEQLRNEVHKSQKDNATITEILQTVKEQTEEIYSLICQCERFKEENFALQIINSNLKDKLSSNCKDLESHISETQSLKEKIEDAERFIAELNDKISQFEMRIHELKKERDKVKNDAVKEIRGLNENFSAVSSELEKAIETVKKQKKEMEDMAKELNNSTGIIFQLQEDKNKLTEEMDELSKNFDILTTNEISHKEKLQTFNAQLDGSLNVIAEKEKEIEDLKSKCSKQLDEIAQLFKVKIDMEEKLVCENDSIKAAHKQELANFKTKMDEALHITSEQEKQIKTLNTEYSTVKNKITQLEKLKMVLEEKLKFQQQNDNLMLMLVQLLERIEIKATNRIKELNAHSFRITGEIREFRDQFELNKVKNNVKDGDCSAAQEQFEDLPTSSKKQAEKLQFQDENDNLKSKEGAFEMENNVQKIKLSQRTGNKVLKVCVEKLIIEDNENENLKKNEIIEDPIVEKAKSCLKKNKVAKKQNKKMNSKVKIEKESKQDNTVTVRRMPGRQLRNVGNVAVDLGLVKKEDSISMKGKTSKRKVQNMSSVKESPMEKILKKFKLHDTNNAENVYNTESLRIQVLKGQFMKSESPKPSPRLTRGRKKLFNSELFQSKEKASGSKIRHAVRW